MTATAPAPPGSVLNRTCLIAAGRVMLDGRKLVLNALRRSRLIPARSSALIGVLDHNGVNAICAVFALMSIVTTLAACDADWSTGAVIRSSPRMNSAAGLVP